MKKDKHECDHPHFIGGYKFTEIELNSWAKSFYDWFTKVFAPMNPKVADGFIIEVAENKESGKVLEISEFNDFFPAHALFELFEETRPKKVERGDEVVIN